jgi:hypothetical protein
MDLGTDDFQKASGVQSHPLEGPQADLVYVVTSNLADLHYLPMK